jgi:hypothetical protein
MHGVFFDLNDFCKKYVDDYGIVGYDMQRSEEDVNISIAFGMEDIYDDDYYEKSYKKGVLSVSEVDETCDNVMVDLNNEEKLVRDVEEASDSFDGPMMKDEDLLGVVEIILAEWRLCSGDMKCILAERAEYVPHEVLSHFKDLGAMIYKVTDCIGTVEGARSSGVPVGEDVDKAHAKGYDEGYDDCMSDHNLK